MPAAQGGPVIAASGPVVSNASLPSSSSMHPGLTSQHGAPTLLRIKRKRTDLPLDALVIERAFAAVDNARAVKRARSTLDAPSSDTRLSTPGESHDTGRTDTALTAPSNKDLEETAATPPHKSAGIFRYASTLASLSSFDASLRTGSLQQTIQTLMHPATPQQTSHEAVALADSIRSPISRSASSSFPKLPTTSRVSQEDRIGSRIAAQKVGARQARFRIVSKLRTPVQPLDTDDFSQLDMPPKIVPSSQITQRHLPHRQDWQALRIIDAEACDAPAHRPRQKSRLRQLAAARASQRSQWQATSTGSRSFWDSGQPSALLDGEDDLGNFVPMLQEYLRMNDIDPDDSDESAKVFPSPGLALPDRPIHHNPLPLLSAENDDDEDEEEGAWVYDVYYRDYSNESIEARAGGSQGKSAAGGHTRIGALAGVDDDNDSLVNANDESSEEQDEMDEDSNDEDFYRNDYPEGDASESDSDDFIGGSGRYSGNQSDDDHDDDF
ncbi:uncharacterized protein L969DRAFT_95669 [Mixia osmundae IAM 14324]|uniref:Probable RNA polymerase II nuclear localization protein SLC7A6OS n=1 Tax=Mixia osmundae (strain CBS 9802 / IAM 14324 / JCM 22182 / KY 12970) TaxID=764103 RepID=G7E834_MIXOS|nr:uncharacterized protein L969DRAFT_95669 [Mixia osmundae IAM 14324]KEI38594.1 hypothetical protein L969DRAFT_95669 [Mixia osmundae IAM 14324]GAA98994.1 hypothetical protein E5Q_05683 [Mixia osmundae IAM 14324]